MNRWPRNHSYFWEPAPFFRILLPLVAGILAYDGGWLKGFSGQAFVVTAVICLIGFVFFEKQLKRNVAQFLLLHICLFFCGLSLSFYNDIRNNKQWFGRVATIGTASVAIITDNPLEKERSWKIPVRVTAVIKGDTVTGAVGDAVIYLLKKDSVCPLLRNDRIILPARWQPIHNAGNPFEFDYAAYSRRNNLFYSQVCSAGEIFVISPHARNSNSFISRTHDWCMSALDKFLPDAKAKGLIQAMLLGDEGNLDEDLRQSYSETGIVHIIAISGGNVAIFFIVVSAMLFWLRNKKHLWVKYTVALPLVWFYVIMAGAPPSAVRAAIMFSLLALAVLLQKNNNSLNQLFATAFVLLCAEPMWLFSVGFQLSFIAVLSLIIFYKPVYRWLSPADKFARLLWSVVAASIAAEILVAPLVIYYFHIFPLLFVIANVAAYLFMSVVLVMGMVVILLSAFPLVAGVLGGITIALVTFFDRIVAWLQKLNPESFHYLVLTVSELILVYLIVAGIAVWLLRKKNAGLLVGLAAACSILILFCADKWTEIHQRRLVVYNVGEPSHIELIDANSYSIVQTDTTAEKKIAYAVKPAHIAWQALKPANLARGDVYYIGDKKVLLLHDKVPEGRHFMVDYLIVSGYHDIRKLSDIFSPLAIIVGSRYGREKWLRQGRDSVLVHGIAEDGAFIIR